MASVTAREIPDVQSFFTELWNLYKKHYIPENDDKYWELILSDFGTLRNKYENLLIAKPMILILLQELEIRFDIDCHVIKSKDLKNKNLPNQDKLVMLSEFLVGTCTHDEIDRFCITLLDANLKRRNSSAKGGIEGERNEARH